VVKKLGEGLGWWCRFAKICLQGDRLQGNTGGCGMNDLMVAVGSFLGLARWWSVSDGCRLMVVAGFGAGGTNGSSCGKE